MDTREQRRLIEDLEQLEGVEDFLEYFAIEYDSQIVQSKHIPLLRLCRQLLDARKVTDNYDDYRSALSIAYGQITRGRLPTVNQSACATCQSDCDQAE
ncbi:nitrogenase-stabilizing/protective protein NifW [Vibrio natriegens]|uniref:nitrogenase-stabilizing/protective protein NifW n=1 Tax=Vibrio natriegens TaxID=691 RepID=UPI000803CD9A|nr:nitrogenase-stabilizing/protective protein NifW [Vibrio natriegens]ANQ19209.1 hypothetical protein BA891_18690 [Vibrio natriegens]